MRDPVKRSLLALAILLSVSLALLIVFKGAVTEVVVVPLLYLVWLSELTFNSIHQAVLWALMLTLTAMLLLSALHGASKDSAPLYRPVDEDRGNSRRIAYWTKRLARNADGQFLDFQSLLDLRRLILSVWAYHRLVRPVELERQVRSGAVELPPDLQSYFETGRRPALVERGFAERAVAWIRALARLDGARDRIASQADLEETVRILETEFGTDGPETPGNHG